MTKVACCIYSYAGITVTTVKVIHKGYIIVPGHQNKQTGQKLTIYNSVLHTVQKPFKQ